MGLFSKSTIKSYYIVWNVDHTDANAPVVSFAYATRAAGLQKIIRAGIRATDGQFVVQPVADGKWITYSVARRVVPKDQAKAINEKLKAAGLTPQTLYLAADAKIKFKLFDEIVDYPNWP